MDAIDATFDIWDSSSRDLAGFQWRVALVCLIYLRTAAYDSHVVQVFIAISAIKTGKTLPLYVNLWVSWVNLILAFAQLGRR